MSEHAPRAARLLPLGAFLLMALVGCADHELATGIDAQAFTQVGNAPIVNSLADPGDGTCDDAECTLREAIAFATPGATITFSVTGTIVLGSSLTISKHLAISGPGAPALSVSGNDAVRPFWVDGGNVVTISGISITRGLAGAGGGAAFVNLGILVIINSRIHDNVALNFGAVRNLGTLSIISSTVSGNRSDNGAAVYADTNGRTSVTNSTISGNAPYDDVSSAAIHIYSGEAEILFSTITGNGGGTHVYNGAAAHVDVLASIISGNSDFDAWAYSPGLYHSLGHNLIGTVLNVDPAVEFAAEGDQTGVTEPLLGALQLNAPGNTPTHALLPGSPAIDAGTCDGALTTDQRGVTRPQGSTCDIGAVEAQVTGAETPAFTFDLSALPALTYGDAGFSVTGNASTNSSGAITFATGPGSVGCSVTPGGAVTLTGAATGSTYCVLAATLAPDATYGGAGPLSQSFNIAKATLTVTATDVTVDFGTAPEFGATFGGFVGQDNFLSLTGSLEFTLESDVYGPSAVPPTDAGSYAITPGGLSSGDYDITFVSGTLTIDKAAGAVTIANVPTGAIVGGSFTATYAVAGDGVPSVISKTPGICSTSGNLVEFAAAGTCTLQAAVAEGTNHLAATGADQSFTVDPAAPPFARECTYRVNAKNGSRSVLVKWQNAAPGVTLVRVTDGRTVSKAMAPTSTGQWSTSVKSGTPTYGLWGGSSRKDASEPLVEEGTACELIP